VKKGTTGSSILFGVVTVTLGIVFFSIQSNSQDVFGLEENLVTLQTGIISTQDRDFGVSNDFETRIFQNGKIMRISGLTTTGEPYYIYQKNVGDNIILKGKILLGGTFVSIVQKDIISEPVIETQTQVEEPIKMIIQQSLRTYWRDSYDISLMVFEADQNQYNDYYYREYRVPNIPITVDIKHENGDHLTTLTGETNERGYFEASHFIVENLILPGKYLVHVVAGNDLATQDLETYVIGYVRSGASAGIKPVAVATFMPPAPGPLATVTLDGSGSFDPDGMIVTYSWAQTSGAPVVIVDDTAQITTFDSVGAGTYQFSLTVTDDRNNMNVDNITIITA